MLELLGKWKKLRWSFDIFIEQLVYVFLYKILHYTMSYANNITGFKRLTISSVPPSPVLPFEAFKFE